MDNGIAVNPNVFKAVRKYKKYVEGFKFEEAVVMPSLTGNAWSDGGARYM